jgi:hypothetical protein
MRARRPQPIAILAAGLGIAFVLTLGLLLTGRGRHETVVVNVRQGAPALTSGNDALIVIREGLLQQVISEGVTTSKLPFDISDVKTQLEPTGILISGKAKAEVFYLTVSTNWSGVVRPLANPDGTIGVQLTDVHAVGGRLPSLFEPAVEGAINAELEKTTHLNGFKVKDVEFGTNELLVYLQHDTSSPLFPTGGHTQGSP